MEAARSRVPSVVLAIELLYGFIHPLLYLAVIQPAFFGRWSPWPLVCLQLAVFASYWGARGWSERRWADTVRQQAARIAILLIALIAVRDLIVACTRPEGLWAGNSWAWLLSLMVLPMYLVPVAIASNDLRSPRPLGRSSVPPPARTAASLAALFTGAVLGVGWLWNAPAADPRLQVSAHRAHIAAAAREANLDPKLLAAILLVSERRHTSQMEKALEAIGAGLWISDDKGDLGLARTFNASLGLMQVKPVTAMTALTIRWNAQRGGVPSIPSKSYRDVRADGAAFKRLVMPQMAALPSPLEAGDPKRLVVSSLLDDQETFRWAAFLLNLYATQWEAANPQWSLRARPEILATLYQIGFDRSHPKGQPVANAFGEEVLAEYRSEWMREHFD